MTQLVPVAQTVECGVVVYTFVVFQFSLRESLEIYYWASQCKKESAWMWFEVTPFVSAKHSFLNQIKLIISKVL